MTEKDESKVKSDVKSVDFYIFYIRIKYGMQRKCAKNFVKKADEIKLIVCKIGLDGILGCFVYHCLGTQLSEDQNKIVIHNNS